VGFDPQKKRLVETPRLPAWALPASPRLAPTPEERPAPAKGKAEKKEAKKPAAEKESAKAAKSIPANGDELRRRLYDYDERLAKQGVCKPGELVKHVVTAGTAKGYEPDLSTWAGPAILLAVEETRNFEAKARQQASAPREKAQKVA
jgi:hypothetical protein